MSVRAQQENIKQIKYQTRKEELRNEDAFEPVQTNTP